MLVYVLDFVVVCLFRILCFCVCLDDFVPVLRAFMVDLFFQYQAKRLSG